MRERERERERERKERKRNKRVAGTENSGDAKKEVID
jgi:hypothetical protein